MSDLRLESPAPRGWPGLDGLTLYLSLMLALVVTLAVPAGCSSFPISSPASATPVPTGEVVSIATRPTATNPTASILGGPSPIPSRVFPPSTCAPPCWQGITPGRTTIADAVAILGEPDRKIDFTTKDGKAIPSYYWGQVLVERGRRQPRVDYQVELTDEDGIARAIILSDPSSMETMAEVVARYGTPEYVVVNSLGPEAPYWHTVLVYPSKGMTFATDYNFVSHSGKPMPPVTKRDSVMWRSYYEPTTMAEVERNRHGQAAVGPVSGKRVAWEDIPD